MNEKGLFVIRCFISGTVSESLFLTGVWLLGRVDTIQSFLLGSLGFAVSLPVTFMLDKRIESVATRLYEKMLSRGKWR